MTATNNPTPSVTDAVRAVLHHRCMWPYDSPIERGDQIMADLAPLLQAAEAMRAADVVPLGECSCAVGIGHVCSGCEYAMALTRFDAALAKLRGSDDK